MHSELKRGFGLATAIFIVIANMVGSGILTTSGLILQKVPDWNVAMGLWIVGGFIALFGALTMAEMATAYPEVGGDYVYVREAFGSRIAFTYGCLMVFVGFAAPLTLLAYTIAGIAWPPFRDAMIYLGHGGLISEWMFCNGLAATAILLMTIQHVRGHNESAWTQGIATIFKMAVFLVFILLACVSEQADLTKIAASSTQTSWTLPALATSLVLVMYAYTGWNGSVYMAGETRNPEKNISRSLIIGTTLVAVFYVSMNLVYSLALSVDDVAALSDSQRLMIGETVSAKLLSPSISRMMSLLFGIGVVASLSSYIMTGPRIIYAMASDGLLPRNLMRTCEKTHIPKVAIWLQCTLSLLLLISGTFESLLTYAGYCLGIISLLVIIPIFSLRKKENYQPSWRMPLYPYLPIAFVLINLAMLGLGAVESPFTALTGVVTLALPLAYSYVHKNIRVKS